MGFLCYAGESIPGCSKLETQDQPTVLFSEADKLLSYGILQAMNSSY